MSPLDPLRDDGPLLLLDRRRRLPVPEVLVLLLAAGTVAGLLVASLLGGGHARPWLPAGGAVAVALLAGSGRSLPRLDWPVPALLRTLEYGVVLVVVEPGPWGYALLGTLAVRHYDIVYRVRLLGAAPPRWLALATGGWPVRCGVLVVASGLGVAGIAAAALTVLLAPLIVTEAVRSWTRHPEA